MINCRILKQVLVLNEKRNFARAAEALYLSQPTLTRNVQALEAKVGYKIFDRSPRNLQLTPFGKLLVRHAEKIVSASTQLENEIAQFSNLQSGQLIFGVGPLLAETFCSQTIGLFNEQFPNIHIQSIVNNWEYLYSLLLNEKIEFFVSEASDLENKENLEISLLQSHPGVFFCRENHPILEKEHISMVDCLQYSLILPKLPQRLAELINTNNKSQEQQENYAFIECDNVGMSKKIVLNSNAIGIGIYSFISELLQDNSVKIIPFYPESMKTIHGIVKLKNHTLSPAATEFIHILKQIEKKICAEETHYFSNISDSYS